MVLIHYSHAGVWIPYLDVYLHASKGAKRPSPKKSMTLGPVRSNKVLSTNTQTWSHRAPVGRRSVPKKIFFLVLIRQVCRRFYVCVEASW